MDKKDILKQLGDMPEEIYDEIVRGFYDETRGHLEKISKAIAAADWTTIDREAHGIKGSSANLRLSQISEAAKSMQDAAKTLDLSETIKLYELLNTLIPNLSRSKN